jgi:zinc-ribbon domain
MAVTCARCGIQNPDGNQFCQACGTPLAVAAAPQGVGFAVPPAQGSALPGPPPGPPPPPAGYQSPYYAASAVGPQPQVHRTPWVLIISAIVILVLLMVGCGTAIAVFSSRTTSNQGNSSGLLPSPSPAGSPSPTVSPSPSPITSSGGTASNKAESFTLPAGWAVESKDDQTITITSPNGDGSISIGSGASSPAQTAQQNKDSLDKFFVGKYPDTKNCPGSKTSTGALNGPRGIFWELCFTLSSGGQSIQAGAPMFAGANSDGSVYYVILLLTSQASMNSFVTDAAPILQSIRWKLT